MSKLKFKLVCMASAAAAVAACNYGMGDYAFVNDGDLSDNGQGGEGGEGGDPGTGGKGEDGTGGKGEGGAPSTGGTPSTGGAPDSSCDGDTFDHDDDADTACEPWSDCAAGEYVTVEGSSSADRECAPCESGTFSTTENAAACEDFIECPAGEYGDTPDVPNQDATCKTCPAKTFTSAAGATECAPWDTCSTSFWKETEGTATADAVCDGTTWQLGTTGAEMTTSIAVGADGSVYVAGYTNGTFPGNTSAGGYDAFVTKVDKSGAKVWTRQFGTAGTDQAFGVAVDPNGNVLVAGAVVGALPGLTAVGGQDPFLRKYDADGTELWTRQFGSSSSDAAQSVDVDAAGNVFVAGATSGTIGASSIGGLDGWVRRYDPAGTVVWTQQFGSSGDDYVSGVSEENGNVDVAGYTTGTFGGETSAGGTWDCYVKRFGAGSAPLWTEQWGTSAGDTVRGMTSDAAGNVYVVGSTTGTFTGQANVGGTDSYVTKLSTAGAVSWTRQFGTTSSETAYGVALDASGSIYVIGQTNGAFPSLTNAGGFDGYLRKYSSAGAVSWTRMFGTSIEDNPSDAVFGGGRIWASLTTTGTLPGQTNQGVADAGIISLLPIAP